MRAKAVTQGGPAPRLRAWAPASARATEKEELGTICLVQTTIPRHVRANARERIALAYNGFLAPKLLYLHSGRWHYLLGAWSDEGLAVSVRHLGETPPQFSFFGPATRG